MTIVFWHRVNLIELQLVMLKTNSSIAIIEEKDKKYLLRLNINFIIILNKINGYETTFNTLIDAKKYVENILIHNYYDGPVKIIEKEQLKLLNSMI